MELHDLHPAEGSTRNRKRIGRGQGSGRGGTSTRGHKGQKSRSGYSKKIGFEGGQMPIQRRLPKFGFKNRNRVEYKGINIGMLQILADKLKVETLNVDIMRENGLASKNDLIKILGYGELSKKLEISAHKFSKSAVATIESNGGKVIIL